MQYPIYFLIKISVFRVVAVLYHSFPLLSAYQFSFILFVDWWVYEMGDIDWVVRSFGISLLNDTTFWIIAFALVLIIINIILGVFHENNK